MGFFTLNCPVELNVWEQPLEPCYGCHLYEDRERVESANHVVAQDLITGHMHHYVEGVSQCVSE